MSNFDNIVDSILKEGFGLPNGPRTATTAMAVGASPMDQWNAAPNASNVYSLDPRGASTSVVDKFKKSKGVIPTQSTESVYFNTLSNQIMEAESPISASNTFTATQNADKISASNPEWVSAMENMIISARSSSSGAFPITLSSFGSGKFNYISQQDILNAAMDTLFNLQGATPSPQNKISWDALPQEDKNDRLKFAKDALFRKDTKINVDLKLLHNELKKAFMNRGLYCGTQAQFDAFKKGRAAAVGSAIGTAANLAKGFLAPTSSGSTGVFA